MEWLALILLIPYIYIITGIYLSLRKSKPFKQVSFAEVSVSVIVACRNEEKNLPLLLSCLADQDYDRDHFEVIIVDDDSVDSTFTVASGFNGIKNYKIIKNPGSGKKSAIKAGVGVSMGELIVTTDADCRMSPQWLRSIVSLYSEKRPEMITGPVLPEGTGGFFHRFQELEFLSLQAVTAGTVSAGNPVMCNGANLSFRRDVYLTGSDKLHPELVSGDDVFLLHDVKQKGGRIYWMESDEAVVTTGTEPTLRSFLKQRARWISKAGAYRDNYTIVLGIVTFVTIIFLATMLLTGFFSILFLKIFIVGFLLKSIPDYLIISNMASRYKKGILLWFFLPTQFLYPFYVISVMLFWFFTKPDYYTKA